MRENSFKESTMNKKTYLIAAGVAVAILAGCSQETKEHAKAAAEGAAKDTAAALQQAKAKSADLVAQAKAKASEAMEKAKQAAAEAVEKAKEGAVKVKEEASEAASQAMEKAKEGTAAAMEKAKEMTTQAQEAAKAKTAEVATAVQEKAAEVGQKVSGGTESKSDNAAKGEALFAKCAGCHGAKGQMKALGKSPVIAGEAADAIIEKLKAYKAGTRNAYGMGGVMQGQVAGLSDEDIRALAEYISKLK
jgi:cytochrome c553